MMRWRFRLIIIVLLLIPVVRLCAAEKRLAAGDLMATVMQGNLTPLARLPGTNQLRLALSLPLRNAAELTNLLADI